LAFLPFFLLISVALADRQLNVTIPSSNDLSDEPCFGSGRAWERDIVRENLGVQEEERTVATGSGEVEAVPLPSAGKSTLVPGRANQRESDDFAEVQGIVVAAESTRITIDLDQGGALTCRTVAGTSMYIVGQGVFSSYTYTGVPRGSRVIILVYSEDGMEIAATVGLVGSPPTSSKTPSWLQYLFGK
jgi:hypothetical protein